MAPTKLPPRPPQPAGAGPASCPPAKQRPHYTSSEVSSSPILKEGVAGSSPEVSAGHVQRAQGDNHEEPTAWAAGIEAEEARKAVGLMGSSDWGTWTASPAPGNHIQPTAILISGDLGEIGEPGGVEGARECMEVALVTPELGMPGVKDVNLEAGEVWEKGPEIVTRKKNQVRAVYSNTARAVQVSVNAVRVSSTDLHADSSLWSGAETRPLSRSDPLSGAAEWIGSGPGGADGRGREQSTVDGWRYQRNQANLNGNGGAGACNLSSGSGVTWGTTAQRQQNDGLPMGAAQRPFPAGVQHGLHTNSPKDSPFSGWHCSPDPRRRGIVGGNDAWSSDYREAFPTINGEEGELGMELPIQGDGDARKEDDVPKSKTSVDISLVDRCRINHLATSMVSLSQGIPFFHAGDEILRSKSLDRDSYNSGDWFNRLDFTYESNNWGVGLPPREKNEKSWPLIQPRLADPSFKPHKYHILAALENFTNLLKIRYSSPLFRLRTANDIQERVCFHNTGPAWVRGAIVMSIEDGHDGKPGMSQLDPLYSYIVVVFNASPSEVSLPIPSLKFRNLQLHLVQFASADTLVKKSTYEDSSGCFAVLGRTTSVFVEVRGI